MQNPLNTFANVDLLRDVLRFCARRPFSRPCVVLDATGGHFVKV